MRVLPAFKCLFLLLLLCGCSLRRKPVSYSRVILEGDDNPTIREDTWHAGEVIRRSDHPRQGAQPMPRD